MTASTQATMPPLAQLVQLRFGHLTSALIAAAARLGIADLLVDGPRSHEELARLTRMHAPSLYRALRALACLGIFEETGPGIFAQSPVSEFLRADVPGSQRNISISSFAPEHWRAFNEIEFSLRTGKPAFEHLTGKPFFEYYSDEYYGAAFHRAMSDFSAAEGPAVTAAYDFSAIRSVCDVGGGHGLLLGTILERNPAMCGTLFDAPAIIDAARKSPIKEVLRSRCEFIAGSFFDAVPGGSDVYVMKRILHDWDDERVRAILKNVRRVIPAHGKLLVIDAVIAPGNEYAASKLLDIEMLVALRGMERTEGQFRELMSSTGFQLARVIATQSPVSILEATPVDQAK